MSHGVVPITPNAELTVNWIALLATRKVRALAPHLINALADIVVIANIAKMPQWSKAVVTIHTMFE
jgi:hypothetical protein